MFPDPTQATQAFTAVNLMSILSNSQDGAIIAWNWKLDLQDMLTVVRTRNPGGNMTKIRLYIIARISEDAHLWTDKICNELDDTFEVFAPKDHNPWAYSHETLSKNVYDVDLEAIDNSHIGLMLPEYGNDCAWEAGYYAGTGKPAVIFVNTQKEWLRDWMVKGGINYVVTNNRSTYEILKNDPILRYQEIILIESLSGLNEALKEIYQKHHTWNLSEAYNLEG